MLQGRPAHQEGHNACICGVHPWTWQVPAAQVGQALPTLSLACHGSRAPRHQLVCCPYRALRLPPQVPLPLHPPAAQTAARAAHSGEAPRSCCPLLPPAPPSGPQAPLAGPPATAGRCQALAGRRAGWRRLLKAACKRMERRAIKAFDKWCEVSSAQQPLEAGKTMPGQCPPCLRSTALSSAEIPYSKAGRSTPEAVGPQLWQPQQ